MIRDTKNKQYENILEQFNKASQEEQDAAKGYLNEIQDEFGDLFYGGREFLEMAWAECEDEEIQYKLAKYIQDNMIS